MKLLISLFFITALVALTNASGTITLSRNYQLGVSVLNVGQANVGYTFTVDIPTDIPPNSYILVTFPFTVGALSLSDCAISPGNTILGTLFDPAVGFDTTQSSASFTVLACFSSTSQAQVVQILLAEAIPATTSLNITINVPNAATSSLTDAFISFEIASYNGTERYTYADQQNLVAIAYQSAPAAFSGSVTVSMTARNKYDNAIDYLVSSAFVTILSVYENQIVPFYDNLQIYQVIQNRISHYASLYPSDTDFAAQVAPLAISNLTATQCGFEGTLNILFTTGSEAVRNMTMLDITLPDGWTASNSTTYCYFCDQTGGTFLRQTQCNVIGSNYIYLLVRDAIPANTAICLNVTHIQNPLYVVSSAQSVTVRLLDPEFNTVLYSGSDASLTTTAPSLMSFSMMQGNRIASVIFRNAFQYVSFLISSYAGISGSSLIQVTTSPSSGKGFIKGTCVVTTSFVPQNANPVACLVVNSGTVQVTNYAAVSAETIVEFKVLMNTEDATSQSFTASVFSYNADGTVNSSPDSASTASFNPLMTRVNYQNQDFTLAVTTGDTCSDPLDYTASSNNLCFIASGLSTGAGSTLKINTHAFILSDGTTTECQTTSAWTAPSSSSACTIVAGDASFFTGRSPAQVPTILTIGSDVNDQGYFSMDGIFYSNVLSGTDLSNMMLEFVANYTLGSTSSYAYLRVDIIPPPPDAYNYPVTLNAINVGSDTDIQGSILIIDAQVTVPSSVPISLNMNPSLVIYFNPAKFSFTNFADFNTGKFLPYPITFTYPSTGTPICELIKGDTNGPNYHSWHRVKVVDLVNEDDIEIWLPFEQATFTNNDIIIEALGYDDTYLNSFPYSAVNISYPSAPPSSVATLTAGSFDFTQESFTQGAITDVLNFAYDTTGVPSTDYTSVSTPIVTPTFIMFAPWILQSPDVADYQIYSNALSTVYFVNYTMTAGTQSYQSMLVMLQDYQIDADTNSYFDIENLALPDSTSIPAYWIYLTSSDGSAIGKLKNPLQSDILVAGYLYSFVVMSPLAELTVDYTYYQFYFDPNAYYIVSIQTPVDIEAKYGVILSLPTETYPADQQLQTFTCYLILRDPSIASYDENFDLSTLTFQSIPSATGFGNPTSINCSAMNASAIYAEIPQQILTNGILEVHIIGVQNPNDTSITDDIVAVSIVDNTNLTLALGYFDISFTIYESYDSYIYSFDNYFQFDNSFDDLFTNGFGSLSFDFYTDYIFWGNEETFIYMGSNFDTTNTNNEKMECEVDFYDDYDAIIYSPYYSSYRRRRVLGKDRTLQETTESSAGESSEDSSSSDSTDTSYSTDTSDSTDTYDSTAVVVYPATVIKSCSYDTTRKGFSVKLLTPGYLRGHMGVSLSNIIYPTTFGEDISLNIYQGSNALIDPQNITGTDVDPTTSGTALSSVTVSVFPNTVFDLGIYSFTFQIGETFTLGGKIWLRYPPDFVLNDSPECLINSSPISCSYVDASDSIEIVGVTSQIAANTNIVLQIHGFQNPISTTNYFSVQVTPQEYAATTIYHYHLAGGLTFLASPSDTVLLYSVVPSANSTGTSHNIAFGFSVGAATSSGDIIYILLENFPRIQNSLSVCTITDGTTTHTLTCGTYFNFITVNLGSLTLSASNILSYNLTIGPLLSPYNPGQIGPITFTIVDSGQSTVKQKSYASYYGYDMPVYSSTKKYLRIWQDGAESTSFQYYLGTTSHPFYFNTSDGLGYADTLTIQIISTGIAGLQINPSTITLNLGQEIQGFTAGILSGTGSAYLSFNIISSTGNLYETPPQIEVVMANYYTSVNTPSLFNATIGANSFFYQISLDYPPLTDVSLQLVSSDLSITIVSPPASASNTLYFTPSIYSGNVQIAATSAAISSNSYSISLNLGGTNFDSYYIDNSIPIVLNDTLWPLTASFNLTAVNSNSVSLNVTTNWSCVLIYQASPTSQTTLDGPKILSLLNSQNTLSYTDSSTMSSYGAISIYQNVSNMSVTISGLIPENDYKINLYPYQLDGTFIASKTFTIQTAEAERPFILSFGSSVVNMTNSSYNYFACSLCSYLSLPVARLTSPDRPLCDMTYYQSQKALRRRLSEEGIALQTLASDQVYSDPSAQVIAAQSATIEQLLGVDPSQLSRIDPNDLANTISYANQLQGLSQVQFLTNVNFYVLSNKTSSVNDVTQLVNRINNNGKLSYFYSSMGVTDIYYLKQTGAVGGSNSISTVIPSFNQKGYLFRGNNYFVLQASLDLEGMIYAIVLPANAATPLPAQIAAGLDSSNNAALAAGYNVTTYASDGNLNPIRVTLGNLTANTSYVVYYLSALEIPGDIKLSSSVYKVSGKISGGTTNSTTTSTSRLTSFGALVTLIALLVVTMA